MISRMKIDVAVAETFKQQQVGKQQIAEKWTNIGQATNCLGMGFL